MARVVIFLVSTQSNEASLETMLSFARLRKKVGYPLETFECSGSAAGVEMSCRRVASMRSRER